MMKISIRVFALLAGLLLMAACQKNGNNGGQSLDTTKLACVVATDFYMVHFTAYQEPTDEEQQDRKKAFSPYCQDLPRVGKSYLTVDMLDADVKSMPISAKVFAKQDPQKPLVTVPPRAYATGIVELVANLREPGEYTIERGIGRTVAEEDTIRIPLRVALHPPLFAQITARLPQIAVGLGTLLGVCVLAFVARRYWREQRVQAKT
jgi:hypothetical protein